MVTPAERRHVVIYLSKHRRLSERTACRLVRIPRSVVRYQSAAKDDSAVNTRLKELAEIYPRYGCRMLHHLLKQEGLVINKKPTERLYRALSLQVRTRRRKKLVRVRVPMEVPTTPNQRWSIDFVSDQLSCGRRFRVLNIADDYSRECVGQLVGPDDAKCLCRKL